MPTFEGILTILQRHFPGSEGKSGAVGLELQPVRRPEGFYKASSPVAAADGESLRSKTLAYLREAVKQCAGGKTLTFNADHLQMLVDVFEREIVTPDFNTVNAAIETLDDAAELLKERTDSTGFDQSVALLIEQTIQKLKSIETKAAPLTPRKEAKE